MTKPLLSAPTIGTRWLAFLSASTMTLSMPDVQTPSNLVPLDMISLIWSVPVSWSQLVDDFLGDGDAGILGQRLLEALVAVGVGRVTGDAAHVDDRALAAELLEQPAGAEVGVVLLVVREVVGARGADRCVDRDDGDAGVDGFVDGRVERVRVRRVDDEGLDALGDQVADVGELAGRVGLRGG